MSTLAGSVWSTSQTSDIVREILSLVQGLDGKYITFHPTINFKFTTKNTVALDANLIRFLNRLANLGHYYLSMKSYSEEIKGQPAVADFSARHAFGEAISDQLEEHCHLVTELHRQRESLGLLLLHVTLMDQTLARLQHLRLICAKLEHKQGVALLNELYDNSAHGDANIQRCTQQIFVATVQPYFVFIQNWILKKTETSLDSDFSHFGRDLNVQSDKNPKFLTVNSKRLIYKVSSLFKTFQKLINENMTRWLKLAINQAFDTTLPEEGSHDYLFKYNLALCCKLQNLYQVLNEQIGQEISKQNILQGMLGQIDMFFYTMEDCIGKIRKRLKPNQVDILVNILNTNGEQSSSWEQVNKQLTKLDSIVNFTRHCTSDEHEPLVPLYFENDALSLVLVDEGCRKDYLDMFLMMYTFKSKQKAILDCWKDIRNFSTFSRCRWDDGIPDEVNTPMRRLSFKVHKIVWVILGTESRMHSCVRLQMEAFQKQVFHQKEILKLRQVHRQFLSAIHGEVKMIIKEQLQPILEMVPQFCKQVNCFIATTKQILHSKSDTGWHHILENSMQLYKEQLDKLGILEFIDSVPIQ